MKLFLVTVRNLDTEMMMAFLVHASSRHLAKGIASNHCKSMGWNVSNDLHTHDLSNVLVVSGSITRIDTFLP